MIDSHDAQFLVQWIGPALVRSTNVRFTTEMVNWEKMPIILRNPASVLSFVNVAIHFEILNTQVLKTG
jgi:hypothetical protein